MEDLGKRMKRYEAVSKMVLTPRMPFIIRIDGKAFHTYTRNMDKPWDARLVAAFRKTILDCCKQFDGCKFAYWQSDEVSFLFTDYDRLETQAWFNKEVQKLVSISASIFTAHFNMWSEKCFGDFVDLPLAYFDSRVFVLPKEEVVNYFIWRQQDAVRNSIQSLAHKYFSHKECHGLSCNDLQDKLMLEKGVNWNNYVAWQKRGIGFRKENTTTLLEILENGGANSRKHWVHDVENTPIFTTNRDYIEALI